MYENKYIMKISGVIYNIGDTQNISDKFKKRDFVLEIKNNEAYVQKVLFTLILDKVDTIDSCKVGDQVEVDFNLQGKEWTSPSGEVKFFNTLSVYGITKKQKVETLNAAEVQNRVDVQNQDDLPF